MPIRSPNERGSDGARLMRPPASAKSGLLVVALLLGGCTGSQSALDPAGPRAERVADLWWLMFWGAMAIWAVVSILLAYGYFHGRLRAGTGPSERRLFHLVLWGGAVFPAVVMAALTVLDVMVDQSMLAPARPSGLTVEVTGHQWWWEVRYPGTNGGESIATANEIRIPAGRSVAVRLASADVIHSFWVPSLAGKLDMIPGKINRFWIEATKPGLYRGQCAEYCGAQHTRMAFDVVAMEPVAFEAWLARQARPAPAPSSPQLERGKVLFLASGCGSCHMVRGTTAQGMTAPDLTHVGGRLSLAAGMFPNTEATMAGWIASAQHLKPENRMPSYNVFEGNDLRAVAAWLESLD